MFQSPLNRTRNPETGGHACNNGDVNFGATELINHIPVGSNARLKHLGDGTRRMDELTDAVCCGTP